MSKVFANIALSLDGYMTPEGMTIDHWDDPGFKNWGAKWGALMSWLIGLEHFRSSLKIGPGGDWLEILKRKIGRVVTKGLSGASREAEVSPEDEG